jgi:hypothetical protein
VGEQENTIRMRLDVRIPESMYAFLEGQSRLKKLSFEALILQYIRDRMRREVQR